MTNLNRPVAPVEARPAETPTTEPTIRATVVPAPQPTPGATPVEPTVATVLSTLARGVAAEPVLGEGQYLRYIVNEKRLLNDADLAPNPTAIWIAQNDESIYASSAPRASWVMQADSGVTVPEQWGDPAAVWPYSPDDPRPAVSLVTNWAVYVLSPESYDSYSHDPATLLQQMQDEFGDDAGAALIHTIAYNAASPELRVALVEALKLVPETTLISVDGARSVLEWYQPNTDHPKRMRVTVDTDAQRIVATDWWWGRPDELGVPTDVPDIHRDITWEIVDDAPEGIW